MSRARPEDRRRRGSRRCRTCRSSTSWTGARRSSPAARRARLWKAELLAAAGADVLVLAGHEAAAQLFDGLAADRAAARAGAPADLDGAALAIADFPIATRRCASSPRRAPRARRSTSSTRPICATSPSARSSTARRSCSPSRPTAARRCSASRSARGSRACCRAASPPGRRRPRRWRPRLKQRFAEFADRRALLGAASPAAPGPSRTARRPTRISTTCCAACRAGAGGSVTLVGAGPGRSGPADAEGGARAAVGDRHPLRRSGRPRDPRAGPARGDPDRGRQDRPRPVRAASPRSTSASSRWPRPARLWCGSRAAIR